MCIYVKHHFEWFGIAKNGLGKTGHEKCVHVCRGGVSLE